MSEAGKIYLPECMALNNINPGIFGTKLSIGYLWRYREKHNIVKPYFQHPEEWVLKTKHDLFRRLIDEYNAHIFICGMAKRTDNFALIPDNSKTEHGLVEGEYLAKVTPSNLDLPAEHCTYLRGLGFAAEIEILAKCDLLLLMPSGFSEPLWMKQKQPVLLLDPPPMYMAKLWWNRMPLFDNHKPAYALYNLTKHTPDNVLNFLNKQNLLSSV